MERRRAKTRTVGVNIRKVVSRTSARNRNRGLYQRLSRTSELSILFGLKIIFGLYEVKNILSDIVQRNEVRVDHSSDEIPRI